MILTNLSNVKNRKMKLPMLHLTFSKVTFFDRFFSFALVSNRSREVFGVADPFQFNDDDQSRKTSLLTQDQ